MAKSSNQKLKLLYLMKILQEKTDETHHLTLQEIIDALAYYHIQAERKSIYDDLEVLRLYGLDIQSVKSKTTGYFLAERTFQLPELKLLVDLVQASKFITHKKSNELIKKLESFISHHEAQSLQRQVHVANRIKTMNETIYYTVDTIHSAIWANHKIQFQYFEYNIKKERVYKHSGALYCISPFALTFDDENYYLLGFDGQANMMKHYRVDKMSAIQVLDEPRDGLDVFEQMDMAIYSKKLFSMFGGEEETITLEFENSLIGVVIDRFGKEVSIRPTDESHFSTHITITVSPQFFGWLAGLGAKAKILSPQSVKESYQTHLHSILEVSQ